ncbi:MAG: ABC transporter permease, partial [Nakamurella sp.]
MTVTNPTPGSSAGSRREPAPAVQASHGEAHKAVALVLALTAGLSLILALFVSVAVNSGPNGVRLA